ncbi:hypothetical protein BBP40_000649 [Aspergillus hancockii]|nr:hypothetical protein BBP40_000649 [Aspergillus hancockii]
MSPQNKRRGFDSEAEMKRVVRRKEVSDLDEVLVLSELQSLHEDDLRDLNSTIKKITENLTRAKSLCELSPDPAQALTELEKEAQETVADLEGIINNNIRR